MSRNHTYNDQYYDEDDSDEYEQEMHQVNQQYRLRHTNNNNMQMVTWKNIITIKMLNNN